MEGKPFFFCRSREINVPFRVKIGSLEGEKPWIPYSKILEDPELGMTMSNLSPTSELLVTIQLYADNKVLTTAVSTSYKSFKDARRWNEWLSLPIQYSQLPLSSQLAISIWDFAGPRKRIPYGGTTVKLFDESNYTLKRGRQKLKVWLDQEADGSSNSTTDSTLLSTAEMDRLESLIKKHTAGEMLQVDWLDNLAFRQIEKINKSQPQDPSQHYLFIDFVQFDHTVVFSETEYLPAPVLPTNLNIMAASTLYNSILPEDDISMTTVDPDQFRENPIESKYRRLVRSHKTGQLDKELKPNAKIRDELNTIIYFSPVQELSDDEKNLLWKFRYHLTRDKRALTKFLKSISWEDPVETKQAVELLPLWAEIDIADALELLGSSFKNATVRAYAVDRLRKAGDHELELYLLQLVQALKFEATPSGSSSSAPTKRSSLARFLIGRAARNPILGNYFYWYVSVESQERGALHIFENVLNQFFASLKNQPNGTSRLDTLKAQISFINQIRKIATDVKKSKDSRPKKIEHLQSYLNDQKNGLLSFDPIPLPLDPSITVVGCVPEESYVFKSSLFPLKISLKTEDGETYPIMFKTGDDLRQDQLVIQIIILMDQLLRNENIDLKLTPYKILATGVRDGSLQFIPNSTLASVLAEYHGILPYLKSHNPDESNALGIKTEVMDTYVRSCAGYCVITYLLGVGDRHLDNLLICPDGHFFHADFGYILGRDPKPFPPLMKLPIQIIEGMGGAPSDNYDKFRTYCFTAYSNLRKSANLILNLFALMTESSIPDIMYERDKAVQKVKERFCLEMTEDEARVHFQNLINDSVNAFLPMVIERLHNLAQYWRA